MKILLADDDPAPRGLLEEALRRWGFDPVLVGDGDEAWRALQADDAPQLAVIDWVMPGLSGVDLCRRVRDRRGAPYTYLVMLTGRSSREDVLEGLDAGADDYLAKPVELQELRLRLRTGQRFVQLESAQRASIRELDHIRDVEAEIGSRVQQALLLGPPPADLEHLDIAVMNIPSRKVTGDFYDFFAFDDGVDVVVGDVMGKGMPAALLSAAVKARLLRHAAPPPAGVRRDASASPEAIVSAVHREMTRPITDLEFFVTLTYARFSLQEGLVTYVDCGHTKTIHRSARAGTCRLLETDNLPIGLRADEEYRQCARRIEPGDLLVFYSDGVTDAVNAAGSRFGADRLADLVAASSELAPGDVTDAVRGAISDFSGGAALDDDVTCVVVRVAGSRPGRAVTDRIEVPSYLSDLPTIRAFVAAFLRSVPRPIMERPHIDQVVLAADEVAANVMRHAYRGPTGATLAVETTAYPDRVVVAIRHTGHPFDGVTVSDRPSNDDREGGLGLNVIRACVDRVTYTREDDGTNCVYLIKKLQQSSTGTETCR